MLQTCGTPTRSRRRCCTSTARSCGTSPQGADQRSSRRCCSISRPERGRPAPPAARSASTTTRSCWTAASDPDQDPPERCPRARSSAGRGPAGAVPVERGAERRRGQDRQDYYQIDWPIVTRQRQVGVYAEETCWRSMPPSRWASSPTSPTADNLDALITGVSLAMQEYANRRFVSQSYSVTLDGPGRARASACRTSRSPPSRPSRSTAMAWSARHLAHRPRLRLLRDPGGPARRHHLPRLPERGP
jgi:hypothetical protein